MATTPRRMLVFRWKGPLEATRQWEDRRLLHPSDSIAVMCLLGLARWVSCLKLQSFLEHFSLSRPVVASSLLESWMLPCYVNVRLICKLFAQASVWRTCMCKFFCASFMHVSLLQYCFAPFHISSTGYARSLPFSARITDVDNNSKRPVCVWDSAYTYLTRSRP